MSPDSRRVRRFLSRAMIARVASITAAGRPRITPLWFVTGGGAIYLTCRSDSPAARDIFANGEVVVLFQADKGTRSNNVLRLRGHATFHPGQQYSPVSLVKFAMKYYLTPGGVRSVLASTATLPARLRYYRERAGEAGTIKFHPLSAELVQSV